jgi:segregation and condensation protein A
VTPLGELTVRWTGAEDGDVEVRTDYDDGDGADAPVAPDFDEQEAVR